MRWRPSPVVYDHFPGPTKMDYLHRPWDEDFLPAEPPPPPKPRWKPRREHDYAASKIYSSGRYTHDILDPVAVALQADSEAFRHLYLVVVLQALMDACNPQYIRRGERHPQRYEAIEWIEGTTEEARSDRDAVLQFAGLELRELMRGYRRVKESGYDLLKIIDPDTLRETSSTIVALTNDYYGIECDEED